MPRTDPLKAIGISVLVALLTGGVIWAIRKRGSHSTTPPVLPPAGDSCSDPGRFSDPPSGVESRGLLQDPAWLQAAFGAIEREYGRAIARNVERIYRLETAHFKSGQYQYSGSAGMVATRQAFPYGWKSLETFWIARPDLAPLGSVSWCVRGKVYRYLVYPGFAGFVALAEIMKKRNNNPGTWYSTDPVKQQEYVSKLRTISTRYT